MAERRRPNLQITRECPDILEVGNQVARFYPVREDGDDMIHTCCRRCSNSLETGPVSRLTDVVRNIKVGSENLSEGHLQVISSPPIAQVEDAFERYFVSVQRTRKQTRDPDRPALAHTPELGHRTRSSGAQIDDLEAVRRIEPAAVDSRPLPAQGKIPV